MSQEKVSVRAETAPQLALSATMLEVIRAGLEEYALRSDPDRQGHWGTAQRHLPYDGSFRHVPLGALPVSPFELCRVFFADGGVRSMGGTLWTRTEEIVLAYSSWEMNPRGVRRPIVYVRGEYIDEEDFDSLNGTARFGALRELARLLSSKLPRTRRPPLSLAEATEDFHVSEYLGEGFFRDPLNRWAMEMGCPAAELSRLLRAGWGSLPVTPEVVERDRPILPPEEHAREELFFDRPYDGRRLNDIFGLSHAALLAWCRHKRFIAW